VWIERRWGGPTPGAHHSLGSAPVILIGADELAGEVTLQGGAKRHRVATRAERVPWTASFPGDRLPSARRTAQGQPLQVRYRGRSTSTPLASATRRSLMRSASSLTQRRLAHSEGSGPQLARALSALSGSGPEQPV
jgi:hypothetical protein